MTGSGASGLSRVTIVAPRARIDLGLPSDVPLAHLLPTVLGLAGDGLADDPDASHGWSLSRLGGVPLDIGSSLLVQAVRDGEVLYLRPRDQAAPVPVYDDVADAVAGATERLLGRWTTAATRNTGRWVAALALTAGAAVLLFAGLPPVVGGSTALALATVLSLAGMVASRAFADATQGVVLAWAAVAYGFAGGLLLIGDDPIPFTAAPVQVGAVAALLFSVLGLVGVGSSEQGFFATGTAAVGLAVGAGIALAAGSAAAASVGAGLVVLALPAVPYIATRLVRLRPATATLEDDEPVRALPLAAQVVRADAILSGVLIGLAADTVVAAATLARIGTAPAFALAAVVGLLLLSRARSFTRIAQRLPLLAGGLLALAAVGTVLFTRGDLAVRLGVVLPALAVLAIAGLVSAGRRAGPMSPRWGRTADLAEVVLALAVVPLIVWVSGAYDWARSLAGG